MLQNTRLLSTINPVNHTHPQAQGLKAWWPVHPLLNGTGSRWVDMIQGVVGTLTGISELPTAISGRGPSTRPGSFGELRCDGGDDFVTTGVASSRFLTASAGTVSVWLYPTGTVHTSSGGPYNYPAVVGDAGGFWSIARGDIDGSGDQLWAYNWDGTADAVGAPTVVNRWTHVTWVHGQGVLALYINGVLVGSTASGNTTDLTGAVYLGRGYLFQVPWQGAFDDVRFYSRALSAPEIFALYHESLQGYPGLLRWQEYPQKGFPSGAVYSLTAALGTYTFGGQNSSMLQGYNSTHALASYSLNGQAVGLNQGYKVTTENAGYSFSGQAATFRRGYRVLSNASSYALNGQVATLRQTYIVIGSFGSFSFNGQSAGLLRGKTLTPINHGAFALNGQAVTLLNSQAIINQHGTFTFTGQDITFFNLQVLPATFGAFTLNGQLVNLLFNQALTAQQTSYALNGQAINALYGQLVTGQYGPYTFIGQDINLRRSGEPLIATVGVYTLSGQQASLLHKYLISNSHGVYAFNGQTITFGVGTPIIAQHAVFTFTGQSMIFPIPPLLPSTGFYLFTGRSIILSTVVLDVLYTIELNIVPSISGTVQLQAVPINGASLIIARQGSIGLLHEVL